MPVSLATGNILVESTDKRTVWSYSSPARRSIKTVDRAYPDDRRGERRSKIDMPLPRWIEPQLSKLAAKAPTGPQWVHEIKFDGYRMAARIEKAR